LEVSDALKLWNEGFRIVEDIYTLMQVGREGGREGGSEGRQGREEREGTLCESALSGRRHCFFRISLPATFSIFHCVA